MSNIRKILNNGKKVELPIWNGKTPYALYYNGECVWKNDNDFKNPFVTTWHISSNDFIFPALETISHVGIIEWGDGNSEEYDSAKSYSHYYDKTDNYFSIKVKCEIYELNFEVFKNREDLIKVVCPLVSVFNVGDNGYGSQFEGCSNFEIISSWSNVEIVPKLAFANCLKFEINIPYSIKEIHQAAFFGCDFYTVDLPPKLRYLGYRAFAYNKRLRYITIPDTVEELESISTCGHQFQECINIEFICIGDKYSLLKYIPSQVFSVSENDSVLHTVKISEGIERMGVVDGYACFDTATGKFNSEIETGHKIVELYLPSTLTNITGIIRLPSTLGHSLYVYYNGTLNEWLNINKQGTLFFNCDCDVSTMADCYLICFKEDGITKLKFHMHSDGSIRELE